jgi:hypothetical protein
MVLPDLQRKGMCGKGSIFAVLNFWILLFQDKKYPGPCGYEQTNVNLKALTNP